MTFISYIYVCGGMLPILLYLIFTFFFSDLCVSWGCVCILLTGSHDTTIRLWDLVAGKTRVTLTNHKKSVRAVVLHPRQ